MKRVKKRIQVKLIYLTLTLFVINLLLAYHYYGREKTKKESYRPPTKRISNIFHLNERQKKLPLRFHCDNSGVLLDGKTIKHSKRMNLISLKKGRTCYSIFKKMFACYKLNSSEMTIPLPNFYLNLEKYKMPSNSTGSLAEYHSSYKEADIGFVHLPKSGGTSIEKVLQRKLYKKAEETGVQRPEFIPVWHCQDFYSAIHRNLSRSRQHVYYSKRTYGLHRFLRDQQRPFAYITWFREPRSRFVSTYHYIKKTQPYKHGLSKVYIEGSKSMKEFLSRSQKVIYPDFSNFCVRLLQFAEGQGSAEEVNFNSNFEACCGSTVRYIPAATEKHYRAAKHNLEHNVAFVGLLEDWESSERMLLHMLGLPAGNTSTHVNANPHASSLSPKEELEIVKRNQWDIKLYEDAKKIYYRQKREYLKWMATQ